MSNASILFLELRRFFKPLRDSNLLVSLVKKLDWWPSNLDPIQTLSTISQALKEVEEHLEEESGIRTYETYLNEFKSLKKLIQNLYTISIPDIDVADAGRLLFDELLWIYLQAYHPSLLAFLSFLSIDSPQDFHRGTVIDYAKVLDRLLHPRKLIDSYSWKEGHDFNLEKLFFDLQNFFSGLGAFAGTYNIPYNIGRALYFPGSAEEMVDPLAWQKRKGLRVVLLSLPEESGLIEAGIWIIPIPRPSNQSTLCGIAIVPFFHGDIELKFPFSSSFSLEVKGNLKQDMAITLFPPADVKVIKELYASADNAPIDDIDLAFELVQEREDQVSIVVLGNPDSCCFGYQKLVVGTGLQGNREALDFGANFSISDAFLVVKKEEGDGFIAVVLPQSPIRINFDFEFGWLLNKGFYIHGGAGLEYTLQVHRQWGPFFLNSVHLKLQVDESSTELNMAISGSIEIGPVQASIEKVGIKSILNFNRPGGVLGSADIDFGFKAPSGVGISLDTHGLKGGGVLSIDPPNYFGVLNVSYQSLFDLTVIGLISTESPGGSPGFSMLFSILAEFEPLQLGFGFALNGVGGLIGIHRRLNTEGLQAVFKTGSLDAILFPANPIRDANRILSAIQTVFPAQRGYHSLGLMALITWGMSIIEGKLGILIELGGSGKVVLIGQLQALLPNRENPLVAFHLDVMGIIDFGQELVSIDARLYDSRVLVFSVSGEMALRLNYSHSHPDFALAIGGFFPSYRPTIDFPELRRALVHMDNDFADIQLSCYFAITANSVQTGSQLTVHAEWGGIEITGKTGFDALIRFNPFYFEVRFYFYLKVRFEGASLGGLDLRATLSGPNPFHVYGYAEISLFFFSVSVDFDATFGRKKEEVAHEISPFQLLLDSARDERNLVFELEESCTRDVHFKKTESSDRYIDPAGALVFRQTAVPLQILIERCAYAVPPIEERYLDVVLSREETLVSGRFAPGQFYALTDQQKLSAPPFEELVSGKRCTSVYQIVGEIEAVEADYEVIRWAKGQPKRRLPEEGGLSPVFLQKEIATLQGARGLYRGGRLFSNQEHTRYIGLKHPLFTVVGEAAEEGKFIRVGDGGDMSYGEARVYEKGRGKEKVTIVHTSFAKKSM